MLIFLYDFSPNTKKLWLNIIKKQRNSSKEGCENLVANANDTNDINIFLKG